MLTDPQVIAILRSRFREGSTPSHLIKLLLAHPRGGQSFFPLLQTCFREAFAVPFVRASNRPEDYASNDLRFAHLNIHLLHEMVQHRVEWDDADRGGDKGECWLDCLVATDESELIKRANPATLPEFAGCWQSLGQPVQNYIQRITGNTNVLHEKVRILAALAEQLQQRVGALEKQLAERNGHAAGSASV